MNGIDGRGGLPIALLVLMKTRSLKMKAQICSSNVVSDKTEDRQMKIEICASGIQINLGRTELPSM